MKNIINLVLTIIFFQPFISAQSWEIDTMANMPEALSNNAVCEGTLNGIPQIYSFAGIDSTRTHAGIHLRSYRYNTQTDTWDTLPSLPDTLGKIAAIASNVKNKIYIIGGFHEVSPTLEIVTDRVHIFDCEADSFLTDGTNIPVPTGDQSQVVWRDSLIYVISGWGGSSNLSNVQIYNPATDTWQVGTAIPNNNSYKSFGSTGTIVGDTIYYFGGGSAAFPYGVQNTFRKGIIDSNDPTQITWSMETWTDLNGYRMAATTAFGKAFWIGGSGNTYLFDGLAYSNGSTVQPKGEVIVYDPNTGTKFTETGYAFPMDLRGIGAVNDSIKYIAGGILPNLEVSKQTLLLRALRDTIDTTTRVIQHPEKLVLKLSLYPNPTTEITTIHLSTEVTELRYSVYTLTGQLLEQKRLESAKEFSIKTTSYPRGVYWIKIQTGHYEKILKLIKK